MNDITPAAPTGPDDPDRTARPDHEDPADGVPAAEARDGRDRDGSDTTGSGDDDATGVATAVYVRRRRTPSLLLWVLIALVAPAVVALVVAPFLDIRDPGGMVNLALLAALFVGVPLAALAALVDALRERRRGRAGRP